MVYTVIILMNCLCVFVRSQVLYNETEYLQFFAKENNIAALPSTLERCEANLRNKIVERNLIKEAYEDALVLYGSKKFPDDKTISGFCEKHPNLIIGSPKDCHRYYNCSGEDWVLAGWVETYKLWPSKHLHECHYPFLFSEETLKCENYTNVDCGKRYEPLWACRYFRLQCKLSCAPCDLYYPNCENRPDGLWALPKEPASPSFMVCQSGRTVQTGHCKIDPVWSTQQYPYNGKCVHQYAIPKENHPLGLLPSCKGVKDGSYQYEDRPCDAYYSCSSGIASAVKCPAQTVFEVSSGTCKPELNCS